MSYTSRYICDTWANQYHFSGDKTLSDALQLMNAEGLTSLAVVDNGLNVIGNISTVDVKLLTSKSRAIHSILLSLREVVLL